jgi:biopolymer transport protein ExbD
MNVTPLVDIVLVLLIIFMVVTPQMEAGAAVTLPGVNHIDPATKSKLENITLSMTASGQIYLEKDLLPAAEVEGRLKALKEQFPDRRVLLKADRGVKYGVMRELFAKVQNIGFRRIAMQVGDKRQAAKKD